MIDPTKAPRAHRDIQTESFSDRPIEDSVAKKNDVLKQRTLTACICNSPVRRLGSVAAALAAAVVAVAAAEQSVAVSSSRPEMRRRCAGVGWVRQPQTPTLELEPGPETYEYRRKIMTMVIRNPYPVHVHIWTMKSSVT